MNQERTDFQEILELSTNAIKNQSRTNQGYHLEFSNSSGRADREPDIHWIPLEQLFSRFQSNPSAGLSNSSVIKATQRYGKNRLTPPKEPSYIWLLFKELFAGFNWILWIACILAFLSYEPFGEPDPSVTNLGLGIVLFIVITLNSVLNVYQQLKSIKIVASFSKLLPRLARVKRDGREQQISTEHLVPGDIILIQMGDKLPADCRFFKCEGLKINTSELTGESKPMTGSILTTSAHFMESRNIGFYSCVVEEGMGEAVVIATGDNTVLGRMSKLTQGSPTGEVTGLHREVNRFVLFVVLATIFAIAILWLTWGAWLIKDHPLFVTANENLMNSVNMIVGFLPLGLPSAVTLALTIVAKQMYRQMVLVKSLQIIETFNSVSVIATDKTGTLTQNKMTVTHLLWDKSSAYNVPQPKPKSVKKESFKQTIRRLSESFLKTARRLSQGAINAVRHLSTTSNNEHERINDIDPDRIESEIDQQPSDIRIQPFRDLLLGACLCNNAEKQLITDPFTMKSEIKIVGDAADTALYNLCAIQCMVDIERVRTVNPRLKVLPFNSRNKFMITAHQIEIPEPIVPVENQIVLITMKGAPDIVIERCSTYKTTDDQIVPLDWNTKREFFQRQAELGKNGFRVIALCQQKINRQQFNEMIKNHKQQGHIKTSEIEEDLGGFASKNYCFIGLFSLRDPPRPEVPDAVLKARRAWIRVAMVTGDHPTTATAIARQVHIFSSDIANTNGVDTFQLESQAHGQPIVSLYRNGTILMHHEPERIIPIELLAKEMKKISGKASVEADALRKNTWPWYRRVWSSLLNQFKEQGRQSAPKKKEELIPYGIIVTGSQVNQMDSFLWDWVLSHQEIIFARTSPEQKLRIVLEFQRRGEIVSVTGDGTNDAPALKCADLGVAMESGTEVSKEAGDLVLLDNNFSSIIQAIETGRLLSDNLKKVAIYLLPGGSWSQIWPVFFHLWFGIPLALSAFLATIFCMLNDVFMSLAMVTEKAEGDLMSRPPSIRSQDHLLNWKLLLHSYLFVGNFECFTAYFCFFYYWIDNGVPLSSIFFSYENFGIDPKLPYSATELLHMTCVSQSIYYCSVCLFQFFNYFATRTRYASIVEQNPLWGEKSSWYVFGAMFVSICIQIIVTQIFWFNEIFGTAPVPVKYILPTLGFGTLWLLIDELRKWALRNYPNSFIRAISW